MKRLLKIFFFILLISAIIITYARYIGTSGLVTKEYTIKSNIPEEFDGLKIVHFSDIHYKRIISNDRINSIIEEINLINPDIVVFTGDLVDSSLNEEETNFLIESLSKINSKYGKYAIMGEYDYKIKDDILEIYDKSNFIYLENSYDIIEKNNKKIFIGGLGNISNKENDISKLKIETEYDYSIILTHETDYADTIVSELNPNIILGGHSHNGQVVIPFIGGIFKPKESLKYYDEYYKINDTDFYISSGIGVSQYNYRLFNKPSINFYRINKNL